MVASWDSASLIGGHPALDFVNTAGGATKARDRDRLGSYADVIAWALAAGVVTQEEARIHSDTVGVASATATSLLGELRTLREDTFEALSNVSSGAALPASWLGITRSVHEALEAATATERGGIGVEDLGERMVVRRVALSLARLLLGPDLVDLRQCNRCSWFFLDRSGRRHWCSKQLCGNRAKAERHYRRRKSGDVARGD